MNSSKFDVNRKNRVKRVRSVLQAILLLALLALIIKPLAFPDRYKPYGQALDTHVAQDARDGFVALGFFEVTENGGSARAIPTGRIDEFLTALKGSGFQTISQDDIIAYYNAGKPLPRKALFLMFEDGRKDSATLSHKILERLNYRASLFNYADQLENTDPIFLTAGEIKQLVGSSYWETGSNGYRLSYINAYDRYENFLGQLSTAEYGRVRPYLGRGYNHYLMDYLRDAEGVPTETTAQMSRRILDDYALMREVYTGKLGSVPKAYALMHANSGKFGTHDRASAQNELGITETFSLNFNREGFSYNDSKDGVYDLTRMQPQAHWYANHLLMRIQAETGLPVSFVGGDRRRQKNFTTLEGQPEFKGSLIALTSQANGKGLIRLRQGFPGDLDLSVRLLGNMDGAQALRFRASVDGTRYTQVSLENNKLFVRLWENGAAEELFSLDMLHVDHPAVLSQEEDEHRGLQAYYNALIQLDADPVRAGEASKLLGELQKARPRTVAEGAPAYIPLIDARQGGDRLLHVQIRDSLMEIKVDGETVAKDIKVPETGGASLLLESGPLPPEANRRNVYDPVYDGVFDNLVVSGAAPTGKAVAYDNNLSSFERLVNGANEIFNQVVNWFVHSL